MIRLTKAQSITVAVGTIFFFFVALVAISNDSNSNSAPSDENFDSTLPEPSLTPKNSSPQEDQVQVGQDLTSAFTLKKFHRSETKDGRKIWEVKAETGEYFPADSVAKVKDATLWLYQKDGKTIVLDAKEATLTLDGVSLVRASTDHGTKVVHSDNLILETESAEYDKSMETLVAPGHVTITSETAVIEGDGMDADINSRSIRLLSNVSTVIKARNQN